MPKAETERKSMIEIKSLTKKYEEDSALRDINIQIPDGCIFGIIGQSGAGKSTLLRCINGLEKYDNGEIIVNGTNLNSLSDKQMLEFRKGIGMIFQNFALLNRKTVLDNVKLPMECWKYSEKEMDERAKKLLKRVGLEDKLHVMPGELSGGQKQRVAIARALAMEPSVLLCDEATSALDPAITQSILELLEDINSELGITIVMVTHEMSVVKEACDRVAILENGHMVSQGSVEEVFLENDDSLENLMGSRKIYAPSGKELVKVSLHGSENEQDSIYKLAKQCGIPFGILSANITPFHNNCYMGHIYLTAPCGKGKDLADALRAQGVAAEVGGEF